MTGAAVDIFIADTSPQRAPIAGVVVKVFSRDGSVAITHTQTEASGRATFLLPTATTYQARFYKRGVGFRKPLLFDVTDGANIFDVPAEIATTPIPIDPRLCTAFGYFRTPTGAPAAHVDVHFIAKFRPLLLDGAAVLIERAILRTDRHGYGQIDLIRSGYYDVTIQGYEDVTRVIVVPDAPNVNLPDLLFPVVGSVTFVPAAPFTLRVGQDCPIGTIVVATDGRVLLGAAVEDVRWSTSNDQVLAPLLAGGLLTLRGIGRGVAELRAERLDQSIVRVPNAPIAGVPVSVSVS